MRAGEKRGAEGGACCTGRGCSGAMGRGEGSDRREAGGSPPVKRAVLRVVQVIGGEGREIFGCPSLDADLVCV